MLLNDVIFQSARDVIIRALNLSYHSFPKLVDGLMLAKSPARMSVYKNCVSTAG